MTSAAAWSRFDPLAPVGGCVTIAHDLYVWYALPNVVVEQLEADCDALGLDRRRYMTQVLMRRYHDILEKGPGFEKKSGAKER